MIGYVGVWAYTGELLKKKRIEKMLTKFNDMITLIYFGLRPNSKLALWRCER